MEIVDRPVMTCPGKNKHCPMVKDGRPSKPGTSSPSRSTPYLSAVDDFDHFLVPPVRPRQWQSAGMGLAEQTWPPTLPGEEAVCPDGSCLTSLAIQYGLISSHCAPNARLRAFPPQGPRHSLPPVHHTWSLPPSIGDISVGDPR